MTSPIRVALADDQAILRQGLATLLDLETDIDVVGQAEDCAQTLELVARVDPDILLLDVQMPAGTPGPGAVTAPGPGGGTGNPPAPKDGIEVAEHLGKRPRVIILTTFGRPGYLRRTLEAGALGFLVKDSPVEVLVDAIRRVHQGLRVVDPDLAAQSLATGPNPLSAKEITVLRGVAAGETTAQIAGSAFLSEGTVRNHISSAIGKLGAANRAEAVRQATENGWI